VLGKTFNKLQMLATVAALAVGVLVVAPLVCIASSSGNAFRLIEILIGSEKTD